MREREEAVNDWACLGNLKVYPQGCALSNKASPPSLILIFSEFSLLGDKTFKNMILWEPSDSSHHTCHQVSLSSFLKNSQSSRHRKEESAVSLPSSFLSFSFSFCSLWICYLNCLELFSFKFYDFISMCSKESVRDAFRLCIPCNVFSWLKFRTLC